MSGEIFMKKNLIILALLFTIPFLLLGSVSAATSGTTSNYKKVSTAPVKDIVVSQVTVPSKGVRGCDIVVSNMIKNQGNIGFRWFLCELLPPIQFNQSTQLHWTSIY